MKLRKIRESWKPKKKESKKKTSYEVRYLCHNCHQNFTATFAYGTPTPKSTMCSNCGVSNSRKL